MSKLELKPTLSIGGAGGKKGGGHTPVIKDDTIRSTQAIQVIDVLSEGPIKGFAVGHGQDMRKSIYFDDTPVMNPDGTENFRIVGVDARYGEPNQRPLEGFAEVKEHISVGVEVRESMPNGVVRALTNLNANRVMVNVAIPSLLEQKTNGDIVEYNLKYDISIQSRGGGFKTVGSYDVTEKVSSLYVREHVFKLEGEGPWDIRVRRISKDEKDSRKQNSLHFDSLAAIIDSKLNYANTAIVGIAGRAADFSSVPNRSYLIDGLIISVPSNYDPITRTYAGDWDGTFKQEWTNNPAWILYDLLTNNRYGLGKHMPPQAQDKWALYEIAKYCDEMVDDGFGGQEPRFTLNAYIFNDQEAYNLLQTISSMFSGMVYWGAGTVRVVQDRPRSVEALFTNANVVDGRFTYKGTSLKSRHTVAMVTWYDPEDMYRPKTEYVQDDEAVAKWGIIQTQVVSYGTTSRGQAHRYGRRILYTEQYATETVVFRTGLEGMFLMPGDVFAISDATRSGRRTGGRVESVEGTVITLDSEVLLESSKRYSLSFFNPDGVIVTKDIPPGLDTKTKEIRVQSTPDEMPAPGTIWVLHTNTFSHKAWQVVSITLIDDTTVEISGLSYRQDKYDNIDKGLKLQRLRHSEISYVPKKPTNVNLLVSNMVSDTEIVGLKGLLSWTGDAAYYVVKGKYGNGEWVSARVETYPPTLEIPNLQPGLCHFVITPYSAMDTPGPIAEYSKEVEPPELTLPDVQGLALDGGWIGKEAKFKWLPVEGAQGYEVRVHGGNVETPYRSSQIGDVLTYTYSSTDMKADGGPFRSFSVSVRAYGKWGAVSKNWTTVQVGNAQASAPIGITVTAGIRMGFVSLAAPPEDDIIGMVVWCSPDPSCPAIPANRVYDGPVGTVTISHLNGGAELEPGRQYYVRAALYDTYGKDSLNPSTAVSFTPLVVDIGPNTITETEIRDNSISTPKLRANAVMAHHVAANQIVATHIAASQITGSHIRAGTLEATHFRSGLGSGNLLPNAGLIPSWSNDKGQQADGWTTYGGNQRAWVVVSPDSNLKPPNTEYMAFLAEAYSGVSSLSVHSDVFPVSPSTWYEYHTLGAGTGGNIDVRLVFLSATGQPLVPAGSKFSARIYDGRGQATKNLKDWQQAFALAMSPSTAAAARLELHAHVSQTSRVMRVGITRPYVGVATSSLQETPTPWSPPGLGTQIHGGMIKTNTIHANAIAVDRLSAFSSNLGSVTAGDIYGATVRGGNFGVSNAWPSSGGGFHLGHGGLRAGNRNTGRWVEITSNGDFDAPGFRINNGTMDIDHLNVIKSSNIRRGAISKSFSSSGMGAELTVVVDQIYPNVHDTNNTATVFIFYGGSVRSWATPSVNLELFRGGRWQVISSVSSAVIEIDTSNSNNGATRKEVVTPFPTKEQRTQVGPGVYRLRVTSGTLITQGVIDVLVLYK